MSIRKDANLLSSAERAELVTAILELKRAGIYDQFVLRHSAAPMSSIHRVPAFLPWHRRFLWDLEQALQRVSGNPDLGIPYWNWPNGDANASLWRDDLLGGDGDAFSLAVTTGPFREGQWTVVNSSGTDAGPLTRAFGRSGERTLPTQADIDQVMAITPYDSQPWGQDASAPGFRAQIEGWAGPNLHNRGHVWVGGSMLPMTSPNDPVFFMHHCMVDKIWHEWQQRFPNQGYLPVSGGPFGQNLTDPMASTPAASIGSRPIDVLDSTAIGIRYDDATILPQPTYIPLNLDAPPDASGITTAGEINYYQLTLDRRETVSIETFGDSDTFMTLFGPDDRTRELATNDDGGAGFNARIIQTLSAGNYFIQLRLFDPTQTGSYRIQASRVTSAPPPSIPVLSIGEPPLNASIAAAQESDLYQFTITTAGSYTLETFGNTDLYLSLFGPDSQTMQIAEDDDSGAATNARLQLDLQPGTYFARVRHFSPTLTGAYQIQLRSNDSTPGIPAVPILVVNAAPVAAEISTGGETDLYRINIATAGQYTIETLGGTDLFLTLLNPASTTPQIATDDDSGTGLNPRITIDLQPGSYFASVRHYSATSSGAYRIHVTQG